jgi:hypothetical protein
MKYIKKFESIPYNEKDKSFWKIQPTSKEYTKAALDKIGISPKATYYSFLINLTDELPSREDMKNKYGDMPEWIRHGAGGWMFHDERTIFIDQDCGRYSIDEPKKFVNSGYKYNGEIVPEQYEIDSIKYNL